MSETQHDLDALSRQLDKTKSAVFLGNNAAFLGSLMCSLNFIWVHDIPTAATDGISVLWNPDYFLSLPVRSRETDLQHELWHVAYLHNLRRGSRDPEIWNIACDIKIDLQLEAEGCSFEGIDGVDRDPKYNGWVEEDIYDDLMSKCPPSQKSYIAVNKRPDILDPQNNQKQRPVNAVVQAVTQAKMMGQASNVPGAVTQILKKFLDPIVPWQTVLMRWFTDQLDEESSWRRPSRRYLPQSMYLPSLCCDDGRLAHLIFYEDVSGSVSKANLLRFNSEVKFIQTVIKPQRLTLAQFDTRITQTKEFTEDDPFDEITISGRGGTSLVPVREHILECEPTAAVIFSDLKVPPMLPLTKPIPIVWIAINNPGVRVPFGDLIHIR